MPRKPAKRSSADVSDAEILSTTTLTQENAMNAEAETQAPVETTAAPEAAECAAAEAPFLTNDERKARLAQAETRVRDHMMVCLGVGLLPFPLLDLATAITAQVTLVKRLCDLYEVPFSEKAARGIVTSLFGTLGVAGSALIIGASFGKLIPGAGTAIGMMSLPLMSAAYTYAIGNLFIGHFEIGGTLADFESQKYSNYFRDLYQRGLQTAQCAMPKKKAAEAESAPAPAPAAEAPAAGEPQPA